MGQKRGPHRLPDGLVEHLEVRHGQNALGLVDGLDVTGLDPLDRQVVRRRVDGTEIRFGADIHLHADAFDRPGGELLGVQRIPDLHDVAVPATDVLIGDQDLAGLVRLQRKGPRAIQPEARVLEQRRVLLLADDGFIDPARLVGGKEPGGEFLAVDDKRHRVDRRAGRNREEILHLDGRSTGVDELLVDADRGDLVPDANVDVVIPDRPRSADAELRANRYDHAVGQRRGPCGRECCQRQNDSAATNHGLASRACWVGTPDPFYDAREAPRFRDGQEILGAS